jgi:hypothetical protein
VRAFADVERVRQLLAAGFGSTSIARITGIPRTTVRGWRAHEPPSRDARRPECPVCDGRPLDAGPYAYLLGLYLGDGYISHDRRNRTPRLRVTLDTRYPRVIDECATAMATARGRGSPCRIVRKGCAEVALYWRHWPCLFPQHGTGRKHTRDIRLTPWQLEVATRHPELLLRGLVHSDGCRIANRVVTRGRAYVYGRYQFKNRSSDIRAIFCMACEHAGVRPTQSGPTTVSVSRSVDVARLDRFIGPKA